MTTRATGLPSRLVANAGLNTTAEGWLIMTRHSRRYRRFWYHCTQDDHGVRWVPERRCPSTIGKTEPRTPRLCVCPYVPNCFVAALFCEQAPVHVYRTVKEYSGIPARSVWDALVTDEHWLIPPVTLERIGSIDAATVRSVVSPAIWYYDRYRRPSIKVKFGLAVLAWEVLGPAWHPKSNRGAVLRSILGDPDDRFLEAALEVEQLRHDAGIFGAN